VLRACGRWNVERRTSNDQPGKEPALFFTVRHSSFSIHHSAFIIPALWLRPVAALCPIGPTGPIPLAPPPGRTLPAPLALAGSGSGAKEPELSKSSAGRAQGIAHAARLDASLTLGLSAPRGSPTHPSRATAGLPAVSSSGDRARSDKPTVARAVRWGRGGPRRRLASWVGATRHLSARAYKEEASVLGPPPGLRAALWADHPHSLPPPLYNALPPVLCGPEIVKNCKIRKRLPFLRLRAAPSP